MKKQSTTKQTLAIYWRHTKPYTRKLLFIYPTIVLAQTAESIFLPLFISVIITKLAAGNLEAVQLKRIWPVLIVIIALELISHLLWNIAVRVFWVTQELIKRDLAMTVFNHLNTMSYRFFSDRFAGSIVNQTNKFIGSFERLTDALTWNVFKLFVSIIFTVIILAPRAPILVAVILIIACVYAPLIWYFRRQQLPYTRRWAAAETKRTGQLSDTISNILAVKSFANESLEKSRMQARVNEVNSRSKATMQINMRQELVSGTVQRLINVMVIILSIILALHGKIAIGTVYLALTYTTTILRQLWDLNTTFRQLTRSFGDAIDMTEILQIQAEVPDPVNPKAFINGAGSVDFNDIGFWYPGSTQQTALFHHFNLHIKAGEKIGLVGPSGGGKTSITKLLLRFMDIKEGSITIDNQDISQITQADVRDAITYVPQEPLLFHRSLAENISYGRPNATMAEIVSAAKKAHADEFIQSLPNGYDTLVGERGVKLSGGQRQRIAIARALIKDARILLLDEATSALDSESEKLIQEALWKLMDNRTSIVIAHRLSTIQHMDRIVVLDEGVVVEQGSHYELLQNKDSLYAKLWNHQSGGFLED